MSSPRSSAESLGGLSRRAATLAFPTLPFVGLLVFATLAMLFGYRLGRGHAPVVKSDRIDIYVLNVQQGEAGWIRTPAGHAIVIGAGQPGDGNRIVADLQRAGIRKVDVLALPYPYEEAIGGASEILNSIPVDQVIEPGGPVVNQWQQKFRSLCVSRKIPDRDVSAGDQLAVDRVRIAVLGPGKPAVTAAPTAANNSLVLRIRWRDNALVWAGGLDRAGEDALLSRVPDLSASWLRVARFGSRNASSAEFLSAVSPEIAVVSVGPNSDGYPHAETMSRLRATGARLFETSSSANQLHFRGDGSHITFVQDR